MNRDSGTFGSSTVMVAGHAATRAGAAMRAALSNAATGGRCLPSECTIVVAGLCTPEGLVPWESLNSVPETVGEAWELPASYVGNVQAFRVALHRPTGVVTILDSVHAVDAGTVLNEAQLRGQVEGAVVQGIGATLSEMVVVREGHVINPSLRAYRIPQAGRFPATRVLFAETHDPQGPRGAKSVAEAPINAVAPALANAIADAAGGCPPDLPLTPSRVWAHLRAEPHQMPCQNWAHPDSVW